MRRSDGRVSPQPWPSSPISRAAAVRLGFLNRHRAGRRSPVSYIEKGALQWRQWVIVNRREAAANLNLLRQIEPPRRITVVWGRNVSLPEKGYNWDSVVLEPALRSIREDFETFWESESWFTAHVKKRRLSKRRNI